MLASELDRRCAVPLLCGMFQRADTSAQSLRVDTPFVRRYGRRVSRMILRGALAHAVLASVLVLDVSAYAQTSAQMATRRMLMEQAQASSQQGDHAHALDLARRGAEIHMTPSLRMFIAQQEAAVGQLAAALGDADQCRDEAERDQTTQNRSAVIAQCRDLESSLHAQVGQLTVIMPDPLPGGLHVTVGGDALAPAFYGMASVVNPGDVVVDATADGSPSFHQVVHVEHGGTASIHVTFASENTQSASSPSPAPATTSSDNPPTTATSSGSSRSQSAAAAAHSADTHGAWMTPLRGVGIAAGLLGVVALGVGAGLYFDVDGTFNRCVSQGGCPSASLPRGEDVAAFGMFWGGAAVFVVGAAIVIAAPREHIPSGVAVWVDPRGSAGIVGRF